MTITEIAKALNVSRTTVSVCLSGREGDRRFCIKPEKAELIRAYAQRIGYIPNRAGSLLRSSESVPPVGLLFSAEGENSFSGFREIITYLEAHGREMATMCYKRYKLSNVLAVLRSMGVKQVVVLGNVTEPCPIHHKSFLLGRTSKERDNVEAYLADWKLVERFSAEMEIFFLDYAFPIPVSGGLDTIYRFGVDANMIIKDILRMIKSNGSGTVVLGRWGENCDDLIPDLIESSDFIIEPDFAENRYEEGWRIGQQLVKIYRKKPFRTVFFANDQAAAGIMVALLEAGLRIPDDVGVIGYGDEKFSRFLRVPLTSVCTNRKTHVQRIARAIVGEGKLPMKNNMFSCELVYRDSFPVDSTKKGLSCSRMHLPEQLSQACMNTDEKKPEGSVL